MVTSSTSIRSRASATTRASIPSYRPQAKTRCAEREYFSALACVNGTPEGVGTTSRASGASPVTASSALPQGPGAITNPGPPAEGGIVHSVMDIARPVPQVMHAQLDGAPGRGLAEQRDTERAEVFRKDRDDVDAHAPSPPPTPCAAHAQSSPAHVSPGPRQPGPTSARQPGPRSAQAHVSPSGRAQVSPD